jgi:tRNA dimethylallyltransferase
MTFPILQPVLVLVGPTAIGKTALSLNIAEIFDCEIVNMDSMQVYRYMDIGTAKVTKEERAVCPHHLIDIVDPDQPYDAERFTVDCLAAIEEIHARNKIPLVTGGTGLYLKSLVGGLFDGGQQYSDVRAWLKGRLAAEGNSILHDELTIYDCISAEKIHKNDTHRLLRALEIYHGSGIPWSEHLQLQAGQPQRPRFAKMLQIGLNCKRDLLYERINRRSRMMLDAGLEQEVRGLLDSGYSATLKSMLSIGYRHMANYILKIWSKQEMEDLLARDTRRYAKRQLTWFTRAKDIQWYDIADSAKVRECITAWLSCNR